MDRSRRRKLEQAVAQLRIRHGDQIVRRASELSQPRFVPHIPTGFPALDALTGGGIPQRALTLFGGRSTSGKLTLAYKTIASLHATNPSASAVVLDLSHSADPDYLGRCGVNLERLLLVRPQSCQETVSSLLDLVREPSVGAIVVNSLPHLLADRRDARYFNNNLALLSSHLHTSSCALICLEEPQPPWLHWLGWQRSFEVEQWSALVITLKREQWLYRKEELVGYKAGVRLHKSRYTNARGNAAIEIQFNGAVKVASTW